MSDSINKMIKRMKELEKQNKSVHEIWDDWIYTERIKYNLKRYRTYYEY